MYHKSEQRNLPVQVLISPLLPYMDFLYYKMLMAVAVIMMFILYYKILMAVVMIHGPATTINKILYSN